MAEQESDFLRTKDALIKYYQGICSAQAVRLIAFSTGLFTVLGAVQASSEGRLHVVFKDLPSIINFGFTPTGLAIIRFIVLFTSISILNIFIFRAIFRYTAYTSIANEFIFLTKKELEENGEKSLHHKISDAIIIKITEKNPKKLFKIVPISWFFSHAQENNSIQLLKGLVLSVMLSIASAGLLVLMLW